MGACSLWVGLDRGSGNPVLRIILNFIGDPTVSRFTALALAIIAGGLMFSSVTLADQPPAQIRLINGHFEPQQLAVTAGEPLTLDVSNATDRPIEFESFKLNREKVVEPGETITVHLRPLSPGAYDFYDDFHQDVPEGSIVAR